MSREPSADFRSLADEGDEDFELIRCVDAFFTTLSLIVIRRKYEDFTTIGMMQAADVLRSRLTRP